MNQSQLSREPQSALTSMPCSLASGCEQVHSSVASPASGLAAGPSSATSFGMMQNVASPGTYIQIPINAEVHCVSTFSLPTSVRKKIYGVTYNVPKANDSSKPTTAIYICPVNSVKLIEAKNLLPLVHKPSSSVCGAKSVTGSEKPISSPTPKVPSKETSLRRQDTKMNRAGKESTVTPTPVSVKFCSNLASQVLKTFVKQPGKGGSMDNLMKTYFSSPLEMKTANSFKDNALLLFNGQLFFLAQKGTEIPTGADKGKLSEKESGTHEVKVVPGETDCFQSRIDAGHTLASSSVARPDIDSCETKCNLETNRKECAVTRDAGLNIPTDASAITRQNGLELAQQIVKHLPNVSGSCARPMSSEYKDLLLKAGIHSDVSVYLYRISMNGDADTSGRWLECPTRCIPQLCKEPDPVNLEECPILSREPELAKPEGCPDPVREGDQAELKECPELSREVDLGGSEEYLDNARVPASFLSQKCPELSKESEPVVMEECAANSIVLKPAELEECPSISRESGPVTLEECYGHSKNNVSVALQEDGDPCKIPGSAGFRDHLEPTVKSADLKDCLLESEEECQNKGRRKRKEVEIENPSSGWPNPSWEDDKSAPHKRSKDHKEIPPSETSADSQRETRGLLNVGGPKNAETEHSAPFCLLELNKEQSKLPSQDGFHPAQHENPLEVDETIRDEKINRLKEALKEKQAALDHMRKKVTLSYSGSCSTLEPL